MNPAYRTALFRVAGPLPEGDFSILTAYNPNGEKASPEKNQLADQSLRRDLDAQEPPPLRITGMSPDQTHQEPGWTVWNLEETIRLAQKYQQIAYYRVSGQNLHLIETATHRRENLGPFSGFLIG